MNKGLLIKHIKGETSLAESEKVIAWIDKSGENEAYYMNLMNTVIVEDVTRERPSAVFLREDELSDSLAAIKQKMEDSEKKRRVAADNVRWGKINVIRFSAYAAGVLLLLSVGLNLYQYFNKPVSAVFGTDKMAAVLQAENTFYTENGVKGKVILPDSSVVWLNSGSVITYPQQFDKDVRRVKFSGEGYFNVVKNPDSPMEVITPKGMKITVLGTKFHICSYTNDTEEQATLFSGRINISQIKGNKEIVKSRELKPQESVRFGHGGKAVLTPAVDTTKKVAWKRGELLFEQTPMPEVIKKLERWHGVNVIVKDSTILKYKFTAEFGSESMVQILELFRFTSPIDFSVKENEVLLFKRKD